jgi:hypothetical protein
MRRDPRLLMAAKGGANMSFALMVNEEFQLSRRAGNAPWKRSL